MRAVSMQVRSVFSARKCSISYGVHHVHCRKVSRRSYVTAVLHQDVVPLEICIMALVIKDLVR